MLALAAMLMLSCPSQPDPLVIIEDYDFIITGGNYRIEIPSDGDDGFVITQGQEYTVAFTIENCDEDFVGSRIGGKLVYKEGSGEDQILSGWAWASPAIIVGPATYRWNFKAGEKNDDDKPIANPATTPAEAVQYFTLNAQDGYSQYPSYYEFRIKGSITVAEKPVYSGTLQRTQDIALDFTGSGHDQNKGIGNIQGTEFAKVQAAGPGAELRFLITNVTVTEQAGIDGNSYGSVGNRDNTISGTNPNAMFSIPKGTGAQSNFSFTAIIPVEEALTHVLSGQSHLFVNVWDDAVCSKVELWEYK